MLPANQELHIKEACPNRRKSCPRCGEAVILSQFASHDKDGGCARRVVPCTACGTLCVADELKEHEVRCPGRRRIGGGERVVEDETRCRVAQDLLIACQPRVPLFHNKGVLNDPILYAHSLRRKNVCIRRTKRCAALVLKLFCLHTRIFFF